jgi:malto-oligosyltrehalose synthase/4-alpha-glucanotransferase
MFNPVATYRIQFHQGFTFKNLDNIIPYLQKLGVSTIYASPIFEATPGSNHGYDVVNPHRINPEIGTLDELKAISSKLKELNINWLQDIVPNHMAFHQNNAWLMDVLEKGRESEYASYFDIIWDVPEFNGKLMVPFLGGQLEDVIRNKELTLAYADGKFKLSYGGQGYPVNAQTYTIILQSNPDQPDAIKQLIAGKKSDNLAEVCNETDVAKFIKSAVKQINDQPELLEQITSQQYYRLCYWRDSERSINYRRFFTVNGLICLNIQDQEVFDHYHRFIKELLDEGIVQGLRIDHIDGLFDPLTYLQRLRKLSDNDTYIVVEKILEEGEKLPQNWPIQGTTGYEFLAVVNNLFTSTKSKAAFTRFYKTLVKNGHPVSDAILEKKGNILYQHMCGELENLYGLLIGLDLIPEKDPKKVKAEDIKLAIGEFLVRCPVYRYYGNSFPLSPEESAAVNKLLKSISDDKPELKAAVSLLQKVWLKPGSNDEDRQKALRFYQRCMQFTGPLMAKGVEDTLMYTYDRFIGHNEVGDSPEAFGLPVDQFHNLMLERQQKWPLAINATSTHDTKRGEDVRARLNVLTNIVAEWINTVTRWQKSTAHLKQNNAPDANDEYLVYQTLAGFYPMPGEDTKDIAERLQVYLTKALREAKTHTQWSEPNEEYEQSTINFAANLLGNKGFMESFNKLQSDIADHTVINSLSQLLLKFTCPGVPDIYHGCELWDFSLVDPDNRRPVDYETRSDFLDDMGDLKSVWVDRYTGKAKLWLTQKLLRLRKENIRLFEQGEYIPLQINGKYSNNVIAFARKYLREWVIVVCPLHLAELKLTDIAGHDWADTSIIIPEDAPLQWTNIINANESIFDKAVPVNSIMSDMPLAVLLSAKPNGDRSAGIIMHITSLPSAFSIGDMGPEARKFADFLSHSNQKYWQLLPLNPTSASAYYSPYSSLSSMAGNTLLISPDDLISDGLLTDDDVESYKKPLGDKVDYKAAESIKQQLLNTAFERFNQTADTAIKQAYQDFKNEEAYWLNDFALYEVLKACHNDKPWYEWPDKFKCNDKAAIDAFTEEQQTGIEKSKWRQFIFYRQWTALRRYGNERGIKFFGDLPFYVSYDSVDVWMHPEIFKLDDNKAMSKVAGVPPDYFNTGGQLWGMPVYDWDNLAKSKYKWWVDRIRKNKEFFDVVRLDHFRAFYDFWEVPAGEETAKNGSWQLGPGTALFKTLNQELGHLPFIAEDLGDVSPGVYALRDELNLPGMKQLQYAFGADMPVSIHTPHNYITNTVAYTGTHDNNTTVGWFKQNAAPLDIQNIERYWHKKVNESNVHDILTEICYSTVSGIAIIPLQDILGLDENCRMNMPSSADGNWLWRLKPGQITVKTENKLRRLVKLYNR